MFPGNLKMGNQFGYHARNLVWNHFFRQFNNKILYSIMSPLNKEKKQKICKVVVMFMLYYNQQVTNNAMLLVLTAGYNMESTLKKQG